MFLSHRLFLIKKIKNMSLPTSGFFIKKHGSTFLNSGGGTILNASLTVEAAIILPFFTLVFITLMACINTLSIQTTLQIRLEETCRQINLTSYASKQNSTYYPISSIPIIFFNDKTKDACNASYIKNGKNGIGFYYSTYEEDDSLLDAVISYKIAIPIIGNSTINIPIMQHCSMRLFTGTTVIMNSQTKKEIAYITANASVYHTNKFCTYLQTDSMAIPATEFTVFERESDKIYSLCTICQKRYSHLPATYFYVTEYGNKYHLSRECYHLTKDIFEIDLNDAINNYPCCSRCNN